MRRFSFKILLLLAILVSVSACGIKPSKLEAPNGKASSYPKTYPNISTDPE